MTFSTTHAQIAPYTPVGNKIFKKAFVRNYKQARNFQRDAVYWLTTSRNYRCIIGIAVTAFLVLGAAIGQLKGSDYSSHFVHRTGANFVFSLVCLLFCVVEFSRLFLKQDGYWTWEVGAGSWLLVTIIITGLSIANNATAIWDLAPLTYVTEGTEIETDNSNELYWTSTTARSDVIRNQWEDWSKWKRAVFSLYCFCALAELLVLLFGLLPFIFFKINEYRLGYGRRLLSDNQLDMVTKNTMIDYNAVIAKREDACREEMKEEETPASKPTKKVSKPPKPPKAPSVVSSGNFRRAFQRVKVGKTAEMPTCFRYPMRPHKRNYDSYSSSGYGDDYRKYYDDYRKYYDDSSSHTETPTTSEYTEYSSSDYSSTGKTYSSSDQTSSGSYSSNSSSNYRPNRRERTYSDTGRTQSGTYTYYSTYATPSGSDETNSSSNKTQSTSSTSFSSETSSETQPPKRRRSAPQPPRQPRSVTSYYTDATNSSDYTYEYEYQYTYGSPSSASSTAASNESASFTEYLPVDTDYTDPRQFGRGYRRPTRTTTGYSMPRIYSTSSSSPTETSESYRSYTYTYATETGSEEITTTRSPTTTTRSPTTATRSPTTATRSPTTATRSPTTTTRSPTTTTRSPTTTRSGRRY